MGTNWIGLQDIRQGLPRPRLRLLAPLRYLAIRNPEKTFYDVKLPLAIALVAWGGYMAMEPKLALFGTSGLLTFARDLLIMTVPFMVGALAAVAMGSPGQHLDRRPVGVELYLNGDLLTLRQFVCYLLGYLCFMGLITLGAVVAADLLRDAVLQWTVHVPLWREIVHAVGTLLLSVLLSSLTVTVFWSLYFLTDVVNNKAG